MLSLIFFTSCSAEKITEEPITPPEAKLISKQEFDRLLAEKRVILESDQNKEEERHKELTLLNKKKVNDLLNSRPDLVSILDPAFLDERLKKLEDGNYEFSIKNNLNQSVKVVTAHIF